MYNLQQQTFVMSMISNSVAGIPGTAWELQQELHDRVAADLVDPAFTRYIGTGWEIVWGPTIYQAIFSDYADDAMMVVRGTDSDGAPVYVVAIAGTNPVSAFAWLQDFAVVITVPFDAETLIAQGTYVGLSILEMLPDSRTGDTLAEYLAAVADTNATLIFTGHSLGGTLAPTFALDLVVIESFDRNAWKAMYVYPTAAATPGDRPFADLFASNFPRTKTGSETWEVWNANVCNSLDYVPLSWANLLKIPDLYMPDIDSTAVRLLVADMIADLVLTGSDIYARLPYAQFKGRYKQRRPSFCPFLMEEIYQHIQAYTDLIIPELTKKIVPLFGLDDRTKKLATGLLEAEGRPRRLVSRS